MFTVTPGGAGQYYFSTYLLVAQGKWGEFEIMKNKMDTVCTARGDHDASGDYDYAQAGCSGIFKLEEGEIVTVVSDVQVVSNKNLLGDTHEKDTNQFLLFMSVIIWVMTSHKS